MDGQKAGKRGESSGNHGRCRGSLAILVGGLTVALALLPEPIVADTAAPGRLFDSPAKTSVRGRLPRQNLPSQSLSTPPELREEQSVAAEVEPRSALDSNAELYPPPVEYAKQPAAPNGGPTPNAAGQSDSEQTGGALSASAVRGRLEAVREAMAAEGADRATLEAASSILGRAFQSAEAADALAAKSATYRREIAAAAETVAKLKAAQSSSAATAAIEIPGDASLQDLELRLEAARQEFETAQQQREQRRRKILDEVDAKKELNDRLQDYATQIEQIEGALGAGPPADAAPLVAEAWNLEMRVQRRLLGLRSQMAQLEVERFDALSPVRSLERDAEQRRLAWLETQYKQWSEVVDTRRQDESVQRAEAARRQAREADPAWREMATRNAELAEKRLRYAALIGRVDEEKLVAVKRLAKQRRDLSQLKRRVDSIGMNETIGMLLRTRRSQLIDLRPLRKRNAEISKELPSLQWELALLREERGAMFDMEQLAEQYLLQIAPELLAQFPDDQAQSMVRDLLESRRQYLDDLLLDLHTYVNSVAELHTALRDTIQLTNDESAYIDEHVLWIRNADRIQVEDLRQAREGIRSLLGGRQWSTFAQTAVRAVTDSPWLSLASLTCVALWLGVSDRLSARLRAIGLTSNVRAAFRFWPTVEALAITIALATLVPGVIYLLGLKLTGIPSQNEVAYAIGYALQWSAMMWWALSFLDKVSRVDGLGERHFGWHENNTRVLRRNLRWLIFLGLPVLATVMLIQSFQNGVWRNSLGRLSYIVGMLLMIAFMHSLLNPYGKGRGIWAKDQVWLYKVRHFLHGLAILVPAGLAALAAVGYVFSAFQLAYRAQLTLWLALAVTITHAMVSRYFLIIRRRTAVRHMKKRQAELNDSGADRAVEIPADTRLDFAEIGSQLHRLLRGGVVVTILVGLSFIWADMVPALKILERVTVWETSITVTQESTSIDGTPIATPHTKVVPVTLADVLLGCLMMAATIAGTRNLPGLLNITVFEKLPIDHGARYALTLVTRYLTTLVGMAIAFHWIGISWQSVQWLVAAMTVGLGFGLQEIFANFVSGLIILTERPIRIGDIVTVGGITGKVTRMQMRATTITDFDRRELVVPNKKFITEDVVNWTLSDPVTRIVLPVGIAYDCDPQAARDQLLELAKAHPLILKDPEPTAIFTGFGDSTLNLELRAFIVGRDAFAQIQDELNLAINKSFRTAGIEIAYPQRDLHIRSVHPAAMQFSTLAAAPPAANPSPASQSNPDRLRLGEPHLDAA